MGCGVFVNVDDFISKIEKAVANGIPTLDNSGKIPQNQIDEIDPTIEEFTKTLTSSQAILDYINSLVDAKISASLLPQIPWGLITESPTNLSGYGINKLSIPNGLASDLPLRFENDTDTGIYRNTEDYLGFVTGGTLGLGLNNTKLDIASNRLLEIDNNADVTSFSRTSGAFNCAGGGIFMKSFWCDTLNVNSSEVSTSTTTGAIRGNSLGISGNIYAGNLFGNGSGLTSLNASNISSGSLSYLRFNPLEFNLPLNDAAVADGTLSLMSSTTTAGYPITGHLLTAVFGIARGIQFLNSVDATTLLIRSRHISYGTGWSPWSKVLLENSGGDTTITSTVPSTSTTTGALVLSGGGLGVSGTIYTNDLAVNGTILNTLAVGEATRSSSIGLNLANTFNGNGARYSINSILNIDNTAQLAVGRSSYGIAVSVNNSLSSINQNSQAHNLFAGYFHARNGVDLTDNTGASTLYGCSNIAENRSATGTVPTNVIGSNNRAFVSGTLGATAVRASYNLAQVLNAATVADAIGIDGLVQTGSAGATITNAFGVRTNITNTAGTITTAYAFYHTFTGTIGTKYGLCISGEDKNYLSGDLGLGLTNPSQKLDVVGSIKASTSYFLGANQVVGARRTGWTTPTGTPTRTAFATSTATVVQVAERLKALIDDLITHGLIGA